MNLRTAFNMLVRKHKKTVDIDGSSRVLNDKSSFDTVETYKAIRTNIMFSMPKTDSGKVIVITSAAPGEGKTTTSINLAITFAQMGARVLLLDCDLRKPRVHRYLELKRKNGVSNLLCGFCSLDEAIQKNVRDNLDVLPAGEIPPNPAELTATDIFGNVIAELKQKYDYIFIDTPPVTVVTDAAIIMKHSMGVVMVVRHNVTTFDILDNAMEAIKNAGVKVLGVIMLGAEDKGKKYGYYKSRKHGYKYKYGYGYEYGYSYEYKDEGENSESLTTPNAKRS